MIGKLLPFFGLPVCASQGRDSEEPSSHVSGSHLGLGLGTSCQCRSKKMNFTFHLFHLKDDGDNYPMLLLGMSRIPRVQNIFVRWGRDRSTGTRTSILYEVKMMLNIFLKEKSKVIERLVAKLEGMGSLVCFS